MSERVVDRDACITCGDVAVALEVVSVDGSDALCRADDGGTEVVAVELVAPVGPGDRVLVHARVAIAKAAPMQATELQRGSGHRRPAWPGNAVTS